jgi:uncharacterized membrane protein
MQNQTNAGTIDQSGSDSGRLLATLGYIIPLIAIVVLIQRNDRLALYHAKQVLVLFVAQFAVCFAFTLVALLLPYILTMVVSLALFAAIIAMVVIGAMNAWARREKPLPVLGGYAERFLSGITVK